MGIRRHSLLSDQCSMDAGRGHRDVKDINSRTGAETHMYTGPAWTCQGEVSWGCKGEGSSGRDGQETRRDGGTAGIRVSPTRALRGQGQPGGLWGECCGGRALPCKPLPVHPHSGECRKLVPPSHPLPTLCKGGDQAGTANPVSLDAEFSPSIWTVWGLLGREERESGP